MWSRSSKRTFLLDPNRHRFTQKQGSEPSFVSPGPHDYSPQGQHRVKGTVPMPALRGRSEREKILSSGVPVDKISSIGPGDYTADLDEPPRSTSPSKASVPFGAVSPRRTSLAFGTPRLRADSPGPGAYDAKDHRPHVSSPQPAAFPHSARDVCLPVVKDTHGSGAGAVQSARKSSFTVYEMPIPQSKGKMPLPTMPSGGKRVGGGRGGGTLRDSTNFYVPPKKRSQAAARSHMKGVSIGQSPRPMNLTNLNSRVERERDPDYANPPPGSYQVTHRGVDRQTDTGRISLSKRTTDMAVRNGVPGPGAYSGGDRVF